MEEGNAMNKYELEQIDVLNDLIDQAKHIVFFGGAGVSTESGIPDFRGTNGLYRQKYKYDPETILSANFFEEHPEEFYKFYGEKILRPAYFAEPNTVHKKLGKLWSAGKLDTVITQNIDGLHSQLFDAPNVIELHGSIYNNYCTECGMPCDATYVKAACDHGKIPRCEDCGGIIRPDIVLYGEALDPDVLSKAQKAIYNADLLIVGGTSLVVYPAAALVRYYRGNHMVLINRNPTHLDSNADLLFRCSVGEVFEKIKDYPAS